MPRKPATPAPKERARKPQLSAPFMVLRAAMVRILARGDMPTVKIAAALGINRSYVIKLATLPLKPANIEERRLYKLAENHLPQIRRLGLVGLLGGEDIVTTLAGGARGGDRARPGPRTPKSTAKPAPRAKKGDDDVKKVANADARAEARRQMRATRSGPQAMVKRMVAEVTQPHKSKPHPVPVARPRKPRAVPVPRVDPTDNIDQMMAGLGVPGYVPPPADRPSAPHPAEPVAADADTGQSDLFPKPDSVLAR